MFPASLPPGPDNVPLRSLLPKETVMRLAVSWGVVVAFLVGGGTWLAEPISAPVAIACFAVLFATILYAAFGVVREADHLAHALGEPYGTLILTLSVVSIEVILIAAVMLGPGDTPTIGRDSIFAVMMIIMNLITGLCLLLGGLRYGQQEYNAQGSIAYLSMITLLTTTAMILPNSVTGQGSFLPIQAAAVALFTGLLYATFLWLQMRGYRRFFVQPPTGAMSVPPSRGASEERKAIARSIDLRTVIVRSVVLIALMLPIILLAHDMAILIDLGVEVSGAPVAVGGLLIAIIVFTPESITAIRAALANEMQRVLNLCLGAFVSTVGLTVPAVLIIGMLTGKTVVFGLGMTETILAVLTMALTALSFIGLRTSPLQGLMHLMLFAVYAVLLFVP